jgi:hypothetical protein
MGLLAAFGRGGSARPVSVGMVRGGRGAALFGHRPIVEIALSFCQRR